MSLLQRQHLPPVNETARAMRKAVHRRRHRRSPLLSTCTRPPTAAPSSIVWHYTRWIPCSITLSADSGFNK